MYSYTYVAMFCCCGGGGRWCGRSCNDRKRRKRSLVNQLLQDADASRGADRPATWCRVRATRGLQKLHNRHLEDLLATAVGRADRDNSSFWPSECMIGESTTADDRHWTLNKKLQQSVCISVGQGDRFVHVAYRSLCPGSNRSLGPRHQKVVENTGNHLRCKPKIWN